MKLPIYLDNHATTPIDPRVLDAMMPYLTSAYGNAASRSHSFGWAADQAVEAAREQVAKLIGATAREIVFTSGATESNNLALKGTVEAARAAAPGRPLHIVTQATEHNAVLDPCRWLAEKHCSVSVLGVDAQGRIRMDLLRRAIEGDAGAGYVTAGIHPQEVHKNLSEQPPLLVSVMYANNEIGTIQPVDEIGALCRERGVLFHTDAAQAAGKLPIDVNRSGIDLLSISGHKIYGPKGAGALYVRKRNPRIPLAEQMHGGGHERGLRSGTLNVPGIVGLGAACALASAEMENESKQLGALRDRLQAKLTAGLDRVHVNGDPQRRLAGNLSMTFEAVDSESLMVGLRDVALSSGSACTSAKIEASHVLRAIGLTEQAAHSTIRMGLGRFNTEAEIDFVAERMIDLVRKLRELSPEYAEVTK